MTYTKEERNGHIRRSVSFLPYILEFGKFKAIKGHEVLTFALAGRGLYFILIAGIFQSLKK